MTELAGRRQPLMPGGIMREACPWPLVTPLRPLVARGARGMHSCARRNPGVGNAKGMP